MKRIVIIIAVLLPSCLFADRLTAYQEQQVRKTVKQYCNLITAYSGSEANIGKMEQIQQLCSNPNTTTFDDLNTNRQILLTDYLTNITIKYEHSLSVSFLDNINNIDVIGLVKPTIDKSMQNAFGQVEVTKKIRGKGMNKTVKNVFVVKLDDFKIWGISSNSYVDPYSLWLKGVELYNQKRYTDALGYFNKSAKLNYSPAQYSAGTMYVLDLGTKLKRKEREKVGLNFLIKAARNNYDRAGRDLDKLGVEWR